MRRTGLFAAGVLTLAVALAPKVVSAAIATPSASPPSPVAVSAQTLVSRDQLSGQLSAQLIAVTDDRDQLKAQLTSATGERDQLKAQVDDLQAQLAAANRRGLGGGGGGGGAPVVGGAAGSLANHFSYGYCTWYVATRRAVPWMGDAGQWPPNARAMGFAEGMVPRVGAIMATWEGPIGHVAYVEAVNPDGSWVVSEMNYVGWNVVDRRTVQPGRVPLIAFIY
jgi:surface antigen